MDINYDNLFQGIKDSLNRDRKQANGQSAYSKIIKLKKPNDSNKVNEYMFRILPYIKEGNEGIWKTFYYYEKYFWKDELGTFHSVLSRKTFGERCPISDYTFNLRNNGSEWEKQDVKHRLNHTTGRYCNVYVISDPVNPSNNGKVMVLSLNATLWKKVKAALDGELDDEWSARMTDANPNGEETRVNVGRMVTDLSDYGINFNVRVAERGGYPEYSQSEFTRRDARLHLTEEQQKEILDACIDVTKIDKEQSNEEILKLFKESFLRQPAQQATPSPTPAPMPVMAQVANVPPVKVAPKNDNVFGGDQIPGLGVSAPSPNPTSSKSTEEEMESFINGLAGGNGGQGGFNFD